MSAGSLPIAWLGVKAKFSSKRISDGITGR